MSLQNPIDLVDKLFASIDTIKAKLKKQVAFQPEYSVLMNAMDITHVFYLPNDVQGIKDAMEACRDLHNLHQSSIEKKSHYIRGGMKHIKVAPVVVPQKQTKTSPSSLKHKIDVYTARNIVAKMNEMTQLLIPSCNKKVLTFLVFNSETNRMFIVFILIHFDMSNPESYENCVIQSTLQIKSCMHSSVLHLISSARTTRLVPITALYALNAYMIRYQKHSSVVKNDVPNL